MTFVIRVFGWLCMYNMALEFRIDVYGDYVKNVQSNQKHPLRIIRIRHFLFYVNFTLPFEYTAKGENPNLTTK